MDAVALTFLLDFFQLFLSKQRLKSIFFLKQCIVYLANNVKTHKNIHKMYSQSTSNLDFILHDVNLNDTKIAQDSLVVLQSAQVYYLESARVSYCYIYKVASTHMKTFTDLTAQAVESIMILSAHYFHYSRGRTNNTLKLSQRVIIEAKIHGSLSEVM